MLPSLRDGFRVTVCHLLRAEHAREEMDSLKREFNALGARVRSVYSEGILDPRGWLSLYRLFCQRDVTILHTQSPYSGFLGRLIGRAAGVPVIVSTQHLPADVYSLKTQLLDQLTFPLADSVVCVSEAVQRSFRIAAKLTPGRMSVIYNGVDIPKIDRVINRIDAGQKRKQLGFAPDDPLIGNVARLSPQKNQACLIAAMSIVITQEPDTRLVIVGWGPLEEQLRAQIERLDLQDNVFLLGRKSADEVFEILASIDVFALSSVYEGFSLTILEAMAAGKPIVSTKVTGVREAVVDGETGVLVPSENARALAGAILDLIRDAGRRRAMGSAGRKHVEQLFSSESMARSYRQLYESLLEQKGMATRKV